VIASAPVAVIFDMDGLMLDTESIGQRAWESVAATHDSGFDLTLCRAMIGRNRADCVSVLASHYGSEKRAESLMAAWIASYDAISAVEAIERKSGLDELLDFLDAHRIRKAVATSTRRERAQAKLAQTHLLHRFDALVGGDEVARGKPAPDIFIAAAMRLGAARSCCIVLEDSEPGVIAAFAAGMTPIMVPDLHPPSEALLARNPLVLRSLHEVATYFVELVLPDRRGGSQPGSMR
jgi:HAD superfamily hydrolase (TIGR01509 family)